MSEFSISSRDPKPSPLRLSETMSSLTFWRWIALIAIAALIVLAIHVYVEPSWTEINSLNF